MTAQVGPLSYTPIPQPSDIIAQSQNTLLVNSTSVQALIGADHFIFNNDDAGFHKQSTYIDQATAMPVSALDDTQIIMYANFNGSPTGNNELWIDKFTLANPVPFTAGSLNSTGWSYLPSGLLMKWGTATAGGSRSATFNLDTIGPVYTSVFYGLCSVITGSPQSASPIPSAWIFSLTTSQIIVQNNYASTPLSFLTFGI